MTIFLRRWMPVYAPLLVLAAASFQLPREEPPHAPRYLAAFENARYWRGGEGELKISAARMEQKTPEKMDLFDMEFSQGFGGGGAVVLAGARGAAARRRGETGGLRIFGAEGSLTSAGHVFQIRAEEAYYDVAAAALSGKKPAISGEFLQLRGDSFSWRANGELKVQGNVESSYSR